MMELLGLFWIILFIGGPLLIGAYIAKKRGPILERQRDRQIETAMRLAVRDAEAQERIAQRIQSERQQ